MISRIIVYSINPKDEKGTTSFGGDYFKKQGLFKKCGLNRGSIPAFEGERRVCKVFEEAIRSNQNLLRTGLKCK